MRLLKKILFLVVCILIVQPVVFNQMVPVAVEAAQKSGLKKEGSQYYYYKNGKKVKNKWITITKKSGNTKVSYRYYFGKKGAAYQAEKSEYESANIVVKTINKKKYGFDQQGRMVTGVRTDLDGNIYIFNNNGIYNAANTKALKNAIKQNDLKKTLSYLGKNYKKTESDSCIDENSVDIVYTYKYVVLTVIKNTTTGKLTVYELYTR